MLNTVLHHVGLSWMIPSIKEMKYDIKENNDSDWFNKVPQYNKAICSKLYGTVFDDFIRNDITDGCNIICSLPAHDKLQPTYVEYAGSGGRIAIPNNSTTVAL